MGQDGDTGMRSGNLTQLSSAFATALQAQPLTHHQYEIPSRTDDATWPLEPMTSASMDVQDREEQNRPNVSKNGLQILREALGLLHEHSSDSFAGPDSVLIAIDFESTGNIRDGFLSSTDCQVGLAVLDVRDLGKDNRRPGHLIKAHNLVTGSPTYIKRASAKFIFGKSTVIKKPAGILKKIESVIPRDRHIILIGHSVRNELEMLRILGFKFAPSSISAIIDTVRLANEVFGFWGGSLGDLLKKCEEDIVDQATSNTLEQLATSSIPWRVDPDVKAAMKKEKRRAKTLKYQAKFRSVEEQNQIRAERAARRAGVGQSQPSG
ncbi:uncharacterized protein PG986_002082 [Apiospora aurea]|uniref:Gfd2/YDR514C-like C-terminal domain-containing protein n=1 Tax=Apiospora aurea TaxID=335848 RepID=A0ABR1QYN3_9PEZI